MAKSRYEELLQTLSSQGWSQEEIDSYVQNFNGIYEEVCRSITSTASGFGRSGLEVNREYLRVLAQIKNEMAAIATTKVLAGKPMTFYTDTLRGPQGDLYIALKNTNKLKNFLTDPKKMAISNGYPGVKIPLADKSSKAVQKDDEYAVAPKQLFCVLDRDGIKGPDEYLQELISKALSNDKTKAAATSGLFMFGDLANSAIMDRALADQEKDEAKGTYKPIEEYTTVYDGQVKYAKIKYMQDATEMLANGEVYYFGFADGKPAMDLGETIKGTIFDTNLYKDNKPMTVKTVDTYDPKIRHLNIQEDAFLRGNVDSGTCCLGLTRENLTISGFNPIDDMTLQFLSEHYTKAELAQITARHAKYAAQKGIRPVVKKSATATKAPTQKSMESVTKQSQAKTFVYVPSGVVPKFEGVHSQKRKASEYRKEIFLLEASEGKAKLALAYLQRTVKSDVVMLTHHLSEITQLVVEFMAEEMPEISSDKISIYRNFVKTKVYDAVREKIEEEGKAELTFGKKGPTGDLKVALDDAHEEYAKIYKGAPAVDFSSMKGFNMGSSQEEYDSPSHPVGNMTIEKDGKIIVKENAQSPSQTKDDGRAQ